ncbi:terminase large subunit domain-containing protein [Anoxybacillus flavithermus]|uniref:terminase large subunit domain-containing protein n=1 Tax=Anoxybacillus flavithermus TaxID=33934 RepID=UPI0018682C3A|nr:terminase family protein [Anoxybacillus flavithermus]MBE2927403.1 DNA packaging protein [Anoxybacillus flavithermus]MBE2946129.1 DNA packaging protein [Anoxybacillus flavithermus]MBE2948897.1 DNA packaging protein [Anoxybacillus flavithermus]
MAKRLTKEEKLKIIMSDFQLFSKNFIKIIDNNGDTVPFVLNFEQEQFMNEMGKYNIILKGRQIGFTTLSLAYMLYSACTKPDTNYIIMTHHASVSKSLFVKLKKMYKSLPHEKYPNLFPKTLLNNRDELYLDNGSRIIIATAQGEDAISGNSFQMIHLSEMAKYPADVQEEIIATCIPALAKNESSAIIIESTAFGFNTYQEMFMKAWRDKESVWKAHFYSWLAKAYQSQFKHTFDEAEEWFKANNNGRRMTYDDLEHDEKILRDQYGATYRQLMFRRYYIQTNSLEKFKREFPTTPDEAFAETNKAVFDTAKIIERLHHVIPPLETKEVYDILPDVLKPYVNKNLFIYHLPKPKMRMYAGVDVSSGQGGDYSTMSIFDADGQQVASFYANVIPVYRFAEIVDALGRFFNYAFICVERNSYGLPLLERLRKEYEYMNLLKQKVFDQRGKRKMQLGFQTTNVTKPIIIHDMKEMFELGLINIECVRTLEEMKIYQEKNGKMGNKKGQNNHDDLVISVAMAVQAMKQAKYYVDI